jgi:hypothetical protein
MQKRFWILAVLVMVSCGCNLFDDDNGNGGNAGGNQPPTITIASGPTGTINNNTPTFTWEGLDSDGDVVRYYYSIDDPNPTTETTETSITIGPLDDGEHTFYLIAEDNGGASSSVASRSFTIDTDIPFQLVQPTDLVYMGAFRLPGASGGSNWEYSGYAMTYYPDGDSGGPDDGYPGSIFAVGHDQHQQVSEISIPIPVVSGDLNELNTAITLQEFQDITGGMFGELEIPRTGLEYLSAQGSQTTGKLHFCWGQHFEDEQNPTHGWCELDLSNPQTAGAWHFGGYTNYVANDYLFEIPADWAAANTPGQLLATGRFRDGHWSGRGPALFACGPWNDGNPPSSNGTLDALTPLLLYGVQEPGAIEITNYDSMEMNGFKEADEWSGGAWLSAGNKSAAILVGTKATGNCWYGFSDGTVYPINGGEIPEVPPWPHDDRGWWSEGIVAQIIFYDPADLAGVANGDMETYEPQPYASLDIDEYLFDPGFNYERGKRYLVGAVSFDRERGFLYVFERMADEDEKSIVHIWRVNE